MYKREPMPDEVCEALDRQLLRHERETLELHIKVLERELMDCPAPNCKSCADVRIIAGYYRRQLDRLLAAA